MGKSSRPVTATKQKSTTGQSIAATKRRSMTGKSCRKSSMNAATKTRCVTTEGNKKSVDDGSCKDGISELLTAKEYVIPLAERVKLRRMTSGMRANGRKSSAASNVIVSGRRDHASCKTAPKTGKHVSANKRLHKQSVVTGGATRSSPASVATRKAVRVLSERLASYNANIRLLLQAGSKTGLTELIMVNPLDKMENKKTSSLLEHCAGNASATFNVTGNGSALAKAYVKARQRRNVTKSGMSSRDCLGSVRTYESLDSSATEDEPTLTRAESTCVGISRDCCMLSGGMPESSSCSESAERKISSKFRVVKKTARRPLEYLQERNKRRETLDCAHSSLCDEIESRGSLKVVVEKLDDREGEEMPTLSVEWGSSTTTCDADTTPASDPSDVEAMPHLEPLSVSESLPQLVAGSKRTSKDDDMYDQASKLVKQEGVSAVGRDVDILQEREQPQQSAAKRSPRKKTQARQFGSFDNNRLPSRCADSVRPNNVPVVIGSDASVDRSDSTLPTEVNPGPYFVTPARASAAPAGAEQFARPGLPVAPLVVGWYPVVGTCFPNSFGPQQLMPGGPAAVLPPGGFRVMLSPQSVASPPAFLSGNCFAGGSVEMGAARPTVWSPPFIPPVLPQACGNLLTPNFMQPMLAIPGNQSRLTFNPEGAHMPSGSIHCTALYQTQMFNVHTPAGNFSTSANW
jgi:hypothetical protein